MKLKFNFSYGILVFIATFFLFSGCRKYDEGPWIILEIKRNRLCGNWDLEYLYIDNIDSTYFAKSQINYGPMMFRNLKDTYGYSDNILIYGNNHQSLLVGTYPLVDKKNKLSLSGWNQLYSGNDSLISIGPWMVKNLDWTITRLTEKQLWLKVNYQNQDCWVHYKNIGG